MRAMVLLAALVVAARRPHSRRRQACCAVDHEQVKVRLAEIDAPSLIRTTHNARSRHWVMWYSAARSSSTMKEKTAEADSEPQRLR